MDRRPKRPGSHLADLSARRACRRPSRPSGVRPLAPTPLAAFGSFRAIPELPWLPRRRGSRSVRAVPELRLVAAPTASEPVRAPAAPAAPRRGPAGGTSKTYGAEADQEWLPPSPTVVPCDRPCMLTLPAHLRLVDPAPQLPEPALVPVENRLEPRGLDLAPFQTQNDPIEHRQLVLDPVEAPARLGVVPVKLLVEPPQQASVWLSGSVMISSSPGCCGCEPPSLSPEGDIAPDLFRRRPAPFLHGRRASRGRERAGKLCRSAFSGLRPRV